MNTMLRFAVFALTAALPSASMTMCLEIEHVTRLYPDGSGSFAFSLRVAKEKEGARKSTSPEEWLTGMDKDCEGVVAWSNPTLKDEPEHQTYAVTAYFRDIGKFRMFEEMPKREVIYSFELTKTDKGQTLVARDTYLKNITKEAAEAPGKGGKEDESKEWRYGLSITVPGTILTVEGLPPSKGRTAEVRLDDKIARAAQKGEAEAKKYVGGLTGVMKITWSGSDVPKEELEAFKKELASAIENWKVLGPKIRKTVEEEKRR